MRVYKLLIKTAYEWILFYSWLKIRFKKVNEKNYLPESYFLNKLYIKNSWVLFSINSPLFRIISPVKNHGGNIFFSFNSPGGTANSPDRVLVSFLINTPVVLSKIIPPSLFLYFPREHKIRLYGIHLHILKKRSRVDMKQFIAKYILIEWENFPPIFAYS